ncbi:MAG: TonB-dependent receptor, partial [Gemmatimonadetes bacterium]|nr:TonB-dependent receptor [Gemmatimonadota bacterium]
SSNVVIQVNGRPAPFRGDALALYLKQLPAGAVDRVEVLPNPAAKYDPEGMSGIVNIVLRQNTDLGLSAAVNAAGSSRDRFNGSGSVGFQRGRLNLAGMYAVNSDQRRPTGFMERLSLAGVSAGETIVQDTRGLQESLGHSLTGSLDYKLRPATTLSFQASGNLNGNDGLSVNGFRLFGAPDASGRTWASATGTERDLRSGDLMLGLRHVPAAGRNAITLEARLSGNDDVSEARYGDATLASLRELTRNETGNRDASLQLDVTRTLLGIKVETGARAEERVIDTDLSRSPFGNAASLSGGNAFDYDARIWAGYAQASRAVGRLSLQGGLRLEHADTRFDLRSTGEAYDNRYSSLYPSASALVDLGEGRSVRAGYSRRVQRPRTGQLNPFPLQEDSLSLLVGNPSLLPQYTNSFDVTLQTGGTLGTLQVAPFYRVTTALIRHYKTIDPGTGVSTTTFRNFDRSSQYGLDVTATGRLGSRLSGMLGANMAQVSTSAENLQAGLASNALSWSVRSNATLRLGSLTDVQGFLMYRAPMEIEQGRMRSFVVSNVSLRHRVLGGRGDVVLRVTDPLGRMNFGFTTADELHEQEFLRRSDARNVALSFSYSFGRPPSLRPRAAEAVDMDIR